jgi:catechol 2,3-dioxygenase-like lactoylglutathione lyase family enzyme
VRRKRPRKRPETLRLRSVTPSLTVDDLDKSIGFYTGALGFMIGERWTDGGKLLGVMLKAGSCELGLSQDDWAKGRDRQKGQGVRIWLSTIMDVDALASRAKAAGARLTHEPMDEYGTRSFALDDPDGYHLTISRHS